MRYKVEEKDLRKSKARDVTPLHPPEPRPRDPMAEALKQQGEFFSKFWTEIEKKLNIKIEMPPLDQLQRWERIDVNRIVRDGRGLIERFTLEVIK